MVRKCRFVLCCCCHCTQKCTWFSAKGRQVMLKWQYHNESVNVMPYEKHHTLGRSTTMKHSRTEQILCTSTYKKKSTYTQSYFAQRATTINKNNKMQKKKKNRNINNETVLSIYIYDDGWKKITIRPGKVKCIATLIRAAKRIIWSMLYDV